MNLIFQRNEQEAYDNKKVWAVLMAIIAANKKLSLKPYVNRSGQLAVFVEARGCDGFPYLCNEQCLQLLHEYLRGNNPDMNVVDPEKITNVEETTNQVRKSMFTQLVDAGDNVKITPLCISRGKFISIKVIYQRGTIQLDLEKTNEVVTEIREKGFII